MFSPLNDPQVEQWFSRLNAPLKRLPADERTQIHQEVRQHLEALAAANKELDSSPEEAWQLALTQFGDSGKFGKKMAQEWRQNQVGFHADRAAIQYGVWLNVVVCFVTQNICWQGFVPVPWFISIGILLLSGTGLFVYVPIGRRHPFQAIKSAFYTILVCDIWRAVGSVVANHYQIGGIPQLGIWPIDAATMLSMVFGLVFYVAIAYLASVTKRGWYKPTWADFKITPPSRTKQISR